MRENISALMDGELSDADRDRTLDQVCNERESIELWHRYHLIGAAFRQERVCVDPALAARVRARVEGDEPQPVQVVSLIPRPGGWVRGLALAASVVGLMTAGLLVFRLIGDAEPVVSPAVSRVAATERATKWDGAPPELEHTLNAFLVEHGEFTTASGMNGLISYAKFVSYDSD